MVWYAEGHSTSQGEIHKFVFNSFSIPCQRQFKESVRWWWRGCVPGVRGGVVCLLVCVGAYATPWLVNTVLNPPSVQYMTSDIAGGLILVISGCFCQSSKVKGHLRSSTAKKIWKPCKQDKWIFVANVNGVKFGRSCPFMSTTLWAVLIEVKVHLKSTAGNIRKTLELCQCRHCC